jgi:hypothetical protein
MESVKASEGLMLFRPWLTDRIKPLVPPVRVRDTHATPFCLSSRLFPVKLIGSGCWKLPCVPGLQTLKCNAVFCGVNLAQSLF